MLRNMQKGEKKSAKKIEIYNNMKFKKVCTISIMKFELEEEHLYTLDEMKAFFCVIKI